MNKTYPVSNYQPYRPTRNPYGEKIRQFQLEAKTLLGDDDTEKHRGRWREYFGLPPTAFLQLELGCYHGETSNHLARTHPDGGQLGMEWTYKQCFMGGKKAKDQGLKNVAFLRANMARLPLVIAPGEVNRVWILFPDPWSKSAHQKWRVLNPLFFQTLASLLSEGAELMIKTDHQDYAEFIATAWPVCGGFEPMENPEPIWKLIPPTPFERIFLRQGRAPESFFRFSLRRNGKLISAPEEVQKVLPL